MKTQLKTQLFLFTFSLVMFTNCKKSDELSPANIADKIAGNYTISTISSKGQTLTLPFTQNGQKVSGTITIAKVSTTTVSFTYALVIDSNGTKDIDTETGNLEIKQNGSAINLYDLNNQSVPIGSFTNNVLTIDTGDSKITSNKN